MICLFFDQWFLFVCLKKLPFLTGALIVTFPTPRVNFFALKIFLTPVRLMELRLELREFFNVICVMGCGKKVMI